MERLQVGAENYLVADCVLMAAYVWRQFIPVYANCENEVLQLVLIKLFDYSLTIHANNLFSRDWSWLKLLPEGN